MTRRRALKKTLGLIRELRKRNARMTSFRVADILGVKHVTYMSALSHGRIPEVWRERVSIFLEGTRIAKHEPVKIRKAREAFEQRDRQQLKAQRKFKVHDLETLRIELGRMYRRYKGGKPPSAKMRGLAQALGMKVESVWRMYYSPEAAEEAA